MKNAQKSNPLFKFQALILALSLSVMCIAGVIAPLKAYANETDEIYCEEEIYYCDDEVYYDDPTYNGEGGQVSAFFEIDCDSFVATADYEHPSVPSFGTGSLSNACAVMAGTNILAFYDRWMTDLIPSYTPGMMNTGVNGTQFFKYFPNNNLTPITTLMNTLYQLMGTTAANGTTANQFRSGMQSYVSGKGYSISYDSCYQNSTTVNLTKIRQAVENNKIALIMCSTYNFVYDVYQNANGVAVNKIDANRGHMMFVYGYVSYAFYKNGANIRNETFLYVSSGYQSGEQGYIMLNDHLTIEEAYVVTIS